MGSIHPTNCLQFQLRNSYTQFALMGIIRLPEEQGRWAAETALKVLRGQPVSRIPFATNKQGKFVINTRLGDKLKIKFQPALLKTAEIIR